MVKIRLRRTGKTKQPSYRVVIADSRSPRDGRFIEIIGHYNPVRQPKVLEIKADRARYWLSVGAQPTETVVHLFKKVHILDNEGKVIPVDTASETAPAAPESQVGTPAETTLPPTTDTLPPQEGDSQASSPEQDRGDTDDTQQEYSTDDNNDNTNGTYRGDVTNDEQVEKVEA